MIEYSNKSSILAARSNFPTTRDEFGIVDIEDDGTVMALHRTLGI